MTRSVLDSDALRYALPVPLLLSDEAQRPRAKATDCDQRRIKDVVDRNNPIARWPDNVTHPNRPIVR